ncbi:MAG: TetR/AcrR family transcriptional regulator [Spirochaetaceae bacterium]|nr:MAG: TetR/AcrR family transcriptional regulator [Spirochaetaceae bacterium]
MNNPTKRDEIVSAAFAAWGETHFTSTSLNLVAQRLGITKQALYRHFRNKEALLDELTERFLAAYAQIRDGVCVLPEDASLSEIVTRYADGVYRMFADTPHYYLFLVMRLLPGPPEVAGRFYAIGNEIGNRVLPHLDPSLPRTQIDLLMLFMHVHIVVWTAFDFWTPMGVLRGEPAGARSRERRVAHTVGLCLNGHFPHARIPIDFAEVERVAVVDPSEMLEPNRIFAAVEQVVQEVGFEAASMDRIARALGMTKSSLYFYFENKDAMLLEALNRERRHMRSLFAARVEQLSRFSEMLYCYLVTMVTYFLNNRSLLVFSDWLTAQRVRVPDTVHDEQQILATVDFVRRRLKLSQNPKRRKEVIETVALFSILMYRGIADRGLSRENENEVLAFTRDLYQTVTHGIGPGTSTGAAVQGEEHRHPVTQGASQKEGDE